MKFKNRTVWITGASSGIGRSLAVAMSKEGANLILSARNLENLHETRTQCIDPIRVEVLPLDLAQSDSLKKVTEKAWSLFGRIDIVVHNAGISQRSLAEETSMEVDRAIFETDYFGTVGLTKAILPEFFKQQNGHFVVITSVVGRVATPLRSSYSAAKHALHGFFDSLRAEVHDRNVKVTLICPGYVNTNVSINALTGDGTPQGTLDKATAGGLSPEKFAKKALKAIHRQKQEVVIGGFLEVLAVYVKRFFPSLLARMVRGVDVT